MLNQKKIFTLPALKRRLAKLRAEGKSIAFTNGCFDILHYGHVTYLQAAKNKKNRILILGLNSDVSVRRLKGKDRPMVTQAHRAAVVAALECVDGVILFEEDTPQELIAAIKPDVLIKGADWKGKEVAGADVVKANGGRVEFIEYIPGCSTTNLIARIRHACGQ